MRGAWAAGVLTALQQIKHEQFDLVVAVSSGASTAAYFVADAMDQAVRIWRNSACDGRAFSWRNWLRFRPWADLSYLVDDCFRNDVPLPVESFDLGPTRFEVVLTDCRTGQSKYFQPDSRTVFPALKATMSLPLATRGYSLVDGVPYADGGLSDPIPIRRAIALGATDITVVLTHDARHRLSAVPGWLCRLCYPSFPQAAAAWQRSHVALKDALDLIADPPPGITVRAIRPRQPLPVRTLTEARELVRATIRLRYDEAMAHLQSKLGGVTRRSGQSCPLCSANTTPASGKPDVMKTRSARKQNVLNSSSRRLEAVIKSVCERLNEKSEWIVRLAMRELIDLIEVNPNSVGAELPNDLATIEAAVLDVLGSQEDRRTIRMCALGILAQCVFWCSARERLPEVLPQLQKQLLNQRAIVQNITRSSLGRMRAISAVAKHEYTP